jgi:hypothetical protein
MRNLTDRFKQVVPNLFWRLTFDSCSRPFPHILAFLALRQEDSFRLRLLDFARCIPTAPPENFEVSKWTRFMAHQVSITDVCSLSLRDSSSLGKCAPVTIMVRNLPVTIAQAAPSLQFTCVDYLYRVKIPRFAPYDLEPRFHQPLPVVLKRMASCDCLFDCSVNGNNPFIVLSIFSKFPL